MHKYAEQNTNVKEESFTTFLFFICIYIHIETYKNTFIPTSLFRDCSLFSRIYFITSILLHFYSYADAFKISAQAEFFLQAIALFAVKLSN